jgi:hypothetical protein
VNTFNITLSNEKTTKIKVVHLKKLWKFELENFLFELIHYYFMKSFENSKTIEPFSGAGMSSPAIGNHFRNRVRLSPSPGTGTHFQVCVCDVSLAPGNGTGHVHVVTRTWKCVAFPAIFTCGWRCHRHLETLLKVQVKFRTFLLYRVINSPNPRKNWDTPTKIISLQKATSSLPLTWIIYSPSTPFFSIFRLVDGEVWDRDYGFRFKLSRELLLTSRHGRMDGGGMIA